MVAGQSLDLLYENKRNNIKKIIKMYKLKTGSLFEFSFSSPFILTNHPKEIIKFYQRYGLLFGLIFQIIDDLIDEDDLLSSYDLLMSGLIIPDKISNKDCKTSRKACKGCTCGRADEPLENKSKSSMCGNCYLGDGFRCNTCPSKGLPPFNPDEKVMIN